MSIPVKQYRKAATEHDLQAALIKVLWLRARTQCFWFAVPNAGRRTMWGARRMQAEGLTPGVADLCIMLPGGKVIWMELKTAKGRQSVPQKAFAKICQHLGHPYLMPRSLDEATAMLDAAGVLRR